VAGAARPHQKQVLGLGELFQLVKGDVLELSANVVVLVVLMLQVAELYRRPRREIPLGLVRVEFGPRERLLVELEAPLDHVFRPLQLTTEDYPTVMRMPYLTRGFHEQ